MGEISISEKHKVEAGEENPKGGSSRVLGFPGAAHGRLQLQVEKLYGAPRGAGSPEAESPPELSSSGPSCGCLDTEHFRD